MTVPADLVRRIAANPGLVIEQAAHEYGVSARDVVEACHRDGSGRLGVPSARTPLSTRR